ncbi:alpha-1,4-glucan--maltose-1-phosphate maltosyltransferase [Georgenia yuyongxinii]|uniref:Alpha-1,4-glucan:maltose-1-phosphate maltosyltransferase n=1 Tax=Georgenia yuyongxinii TaxID=2589797 RepID=A0A5B8C7N3_9MICO|nr:alpha-1,4-glucan--maltose-1-phosphate maltosyltransferase [Georgenia yuyongxinii]QDC25451.1 alpha-1,4-glucan--maltose-1-phosphate maltosyltransferase [Georgenia yuyongxinii]
MTASQTPAPATASGAISGGATASSASESAATAQSTPAQPAGAAAPQPAPFAPIGRIPVVEVAPVVEDGRWPAKGTVGEAFPVRATVFREGHDAVAATAVLVDPDGRDHSRAPMRDIATGLDRYEAWLTPDAPGHWGFRVEGWSDPYGTWSHDAKVKIDAGVDVELMLTEGAQLLDRAAARDLPAADVAVLKDAATALRADDRPAGARLAAGTSPEVRAVLAEHPLRDMVSPSATYPLIIHRQRALVGSWYEIFPRSIGAHRDDNGEWASGTLRTAADGLGRIAEMGFDVVYLTPIHPIGATNRKGRNNTLDARPDDPGSPYGIGSPEGGHDAIHPDLGTFEDFDFFVSRARELGLEVALDLALQASPDHPWVSEHPEWFTTRADGSIAYAENPPKKYQDIYPLNFDNDPEGIYNAVRDVLEVWVAHGVTAFRVDNPHTKPLNFWQRLLGEFQQTHPEVVFLAEAFTRPAMMRTLGAIGFHQSYTYFTWRTGKEELGEYLTELAHETDDRLRPSFWPTTHDILTPYMQQGGTAAFAIRAVLAATSSPTWGIYTGYELVENVARPGAEEQIDNEKYEFKHRDWSLAASLGIADLLGRLNAVRKAHPALQRLRNVTIHPTSDEQILCFSKRLTAEQSPTGEEDTIVVVLNLDPYTTRETLLHLDLEALGIPGDPRAPWPVMAATDELGGETYLWGAEPFVKLDPHSRCAHILSVRAL